MDGTCIDVNLSLNGSEVFQFDPVLGEMLFVEDE